MEAADGGADAARLDALESTVAEIWEAVRERGARLPTGSGADQPEREHAVLRDQIQRLEERLCRRASRALFGTDDLASGSSGPSHMHVLTHVCCARSRGDAVAVSGGGTGGGLGRTSGQCGAPRLAAGTPHACPQRGAPLISREPVRGGGNISTHETRRSTRKICTPSKGPSCAATERTQGAAR